MTQPPKTPETENQDVFKEFPTTFQVSIKDIIYILGLVISIAVFVSTTYNAIDEIRKLDDSLSDTNTELKELGKNIARLQGMMDVELQTKIRSTEEDRKNE